MIYEFRSQNQFRTRPCPRAESRRDPSPDPICPDPSCECAGSLPRASEAGLALATASPRSQGEQAQPASRMVHAEIEKLGFRVSLATVSRYLPKRRPTDAQRQRWTTFLRNHRGRKRSFRVIAAMGFLVVPTVRFKLLYVWFVIEHDRPQLLQVNVTAHPTSIAAGWWSSPSPCVAPGSMIDATARATPGSRGRPTSYENGQV